MAKMGFSEFIKYASAYEQYLALPEDAPDPAPAPTPAPAAPAPAAPAPAPAPAPVPSGNDWQTIETSLAEILKRMDAAPKPSISDVKPETVDDVIKKILI